MYARRYIDVTLIGKGADVTVGHEPAPGHRITARIVKAGGVGNATAEIAIYGMRQSLMNQLSTYGTKFHPQYDYSVRVEAGDDQNGMSLVFEGNVTQAWADYQSMPDVPFHVVGQSGLVPAIRNGTENSYDGPTDPIPIFQNLAQQMGLKFEQHGTFNKIDSPYLCGSPRNQAKVLAHAVGASWIIDKGVLAIWPLNQQRGADSPVIVSAQTGMVAYPTFTEYGVLVKTEFKRDINYGTPFTIQSDIPPANRTWYAYREDYDLQSNVPKGHWFLSLGGVIDPGLVGTI